MNEMAKLLYFVSLHLLSSPTQMHFFTQDIEGRSALHACASSGTDQSLSVLLAAGCQLEDRDANDRTPLHWAACESP